MADKIYMWGEASDNRFTKSYYWDPVAKETAKNVRVCYKDAVTYFRMNDLGFRSMQNRNESRPLAVVWGDSVVFGQGRRTWVDMLEKFCPVVQIFNGGVEGIPFADLVALMERRSAETRIDYNITLPGWHGWHGAARDIALWKRVADLPGPMFVTMPSLLNEQTINEDWLPYIAPSGGGSWERPGNAGMEGCLHRFWGSDDFHATVTKHLDKILGRNDACRRAAEAFDVPLCDMWAGMTVNTLAQGVPYFQDMGHPEPDAYPWMAEILWRAIRHEGLF